MGQTCLPCVVWGHSTGGSGGCCLGHSQLWCTLVVPWANIVWGTPSCRCTFIVATGESGRAQNFLMKRGIRVRSYYLPVTGCQIKLAFCVAYHCVRNGVRNRHVPGRTSIYTRVVEASEYLRWRTSTRLSHTELLT